MGPPPAWHPPPDPSHHGSTQGRVTIRFCASRSSSFSGLSSVDLRRGHSLRVPVRNFWGNALALPTLDEVLAATGFRVGSCAPSPPPRLHTRPSVVFRPPAWTAGVLAGPLHSGA